jgi:hypothetical protein
MCISFTVEFLYEGVRSSQQCLKKTGKFLPLLVLVAYAVPFTNRLYLRYTFLSFC